MLGIVFGALLALQSAPQSTGPEVIAQVRVHGNTITPEADVLAIARLTVGAPFAAGTIADAKARLDASGRFDDVQVLKRYQSISDLSKIEIVVLVNERPGRIVPSKVAGEPARVVFRHGLHNLMALPILDAEDGYGLTYGVRFAFVRVGSRDARIAVPLSWGGTRQAGVAYERTFSSGALTRVQMGTEITERRNPAYDEHDLRRRVWTRVERRLGPVRIGENVSWERIAFGRSPGLKAGGSDVAEGSPGSSDPGDTRDHVWSIGGDVTIDTRVDPVLARNAVYVRAAATQVRFGSGERAMTNAFDARGYLGVFRQVVLVARGTGESSNHVLPPYLKPLLGGWSNLRGFKAGSFAGDNLLAGSLELRVPVSPTLAVVHAGLSVFTDAGVSYDEGQRLGDQSIHRGTGVSVWLSASAFQLAVSVAHGTRADTRANFAAGFGF